MKCECPYCFFQLNFDNDEIPWEDGEYIEVKCTDCNKPFNIWAWNSICHSVEEIYD